VATSTTSMALDELVESALDRAYLGALSDVGRSVLLEERNRRSEPDDMEVERSEPERPFFASRLPPPGWAHIRAHIEKGQLVRAERASADQDPEPEPEPEPNREPPNGSLKEAYEKLLDSSQLSGSDGSKAIADLGGKVLGSASLRLEHRQRAADVRNAQLVANSARAKEVRLRGEAVARAKDAHAALLASTRYIEFRPEAWRQNDRGSSGGSDKEPWRNVPYQVLRREEKAWLDPGRTPADAAKVVSEGVQAMAQRRERASRLVLTERHNNQIVQIHRLQPPSHTTAVRKPAVYRRAGRAARALQIASDIPSSLAAKLKHQIETGGASARRHVNSGGLEVTPGLNGSSESYMTLRDGEHKPLPAQFISHHAPVPPPEHARADSSNGGPDNRCRVLISSAGETAGVVSPGPAAYHMEVAYAKLKSPRSFRRRTDKDYSSSVAFGTTTAQRPDSIGCVGIRGAAAEVETNVPSASGSAVPAMKGCAWGYGLGVFEETSWTKHIPLESGKALE
jgi:hypothetical protein